MNKVEHTLEPIFDAHSRTLILGSLPSVKSRSAGKYYAHPQNRFWKLMSAIYECDTEDWKKFILSHHLALWDVIKECEIASSSDASIKKVVPNDLSIITRRADIEHIFLLGKKAYDLYNKYLLPVTHIEGTYLPSPSPANATMKFDDLVDIYRIIKEVTD